MARSFPSHLIAPNEEIIFDLNPHWVRLATLMAPAVLVAVTGAVGAIIVSGDTDAFKGGEAAIVVLVLVAACAAWSTYQYLEWSHTHFVLTNTRVITREGVLSKSSTEIPLNRINSVSVSQNLLERFVRIGDLWIESASADGRNVISDVREPESVRLAINTQTAHVTNGAGDTRQPSSPQPDMQTTGPAADSNGDVFAQIERLSRLRSDGIITDTDFENKKAELLARL